MILNHYKKSFKENPRICHCMEEEKKYAALENIDLNSSDVGQGSLDIPISDVDLEDEIDPTQGSESDVDDSLSESDCRDNQSDDEYFNAQNVYGNACTNKYGEDEEENDPEKARKKYDMNYNSHSNYCQFCPKVCKTTQGLANHLKVHQMTHFLREDGDAAKQCDLCEKVFYQTDGATATRQLLSHRRNCKGGIIKSKECQKCGKLFSRPSNLIRHSVICSPSCPHCEKKFQTRKGLGLHLCPKSPSLD